MQQPTLEELTKSEIQALESTDRISRLEREKALNKKLIEEFKEREKRASRALVLYERKIKFMKQSTIDELLGICRQLNEYKQGLPEGSDTELDENIEQTLSAILDICNNLESNALISKSDRDFILNRSAKKSSNSGMDLGSRFDKLKEEFNQKIGSSVSRKRGRPRKGEESIVSNIGLGKKAKYDVAEPKPVKTDAQLEKKISDIFYGKPNEEKVSSGIANTDDSLFDFDEALNPNISLSDIMNDIMRAPDKAEPVTVYDASSIGREVKIERNRTPKTPSKIDMLESGMIIFNRRKK